jgi:hypothetical protein
MSPPLPININPDPRIHINIRIFRKRRLRKSDLKFFEID